MFKLCLYQECIINNDSRRNALAHEKHNSLQNVQLGLPTEELAIKKLVDG